MSTRVPKWKPPPCKCPRYAFPHRETWQCVSDEMDREERRERANDIAAEQDRLHGTYGGIY